VRSGNTTYGVFFLGLFILATPAGSPAQESGGQGDWIDISIGVVPGETPIFPGDPPVQFAWFRSIERGDLVNLSDLHFGAHTGTHIDAPLHFIAGGEAVNQIPLDKLIRPAKIIECSRGATLIDAAEIKKHEWKGTKRILFKTRNSYLNFWAEREFHRDFTAIAPDAAKMLVEAGVELVGIDYLSVEKFGSPEPQTHRTLLSRRVVVVEGLDLRKASRGDYDLVCLPAKLVGRESAPARAAVRRRS
jgi:arylformamidase